MLLYVFIKQSQDTLKTTLISHEKFTFPIYWLKKFLCITGLKKSHFILSLYMLFHNTLKNHLQIVKINSTFQVIWGFHLMIAF